MERVFFVGLVYTPVQRGVAAQKKLEFEPTQSSPRRTFSTMGGRLKQKSYFHCWMKTEGLASASKGLYWSKALCLGKPKKLARGGGCRRQPKRAAIPLVSKSHQKAVSAESCETQRTGKTG